MSAVEIMNELPKLTEAELRAVRHRLLELAMANHEVQLCDQMAAEGAQMLDHMEEEDARRRER